MTGKKQALNYDSPQSLETISKIIAYLLGRPLHGATQQDIANMLGVSLQTANRFIQHMLPTQEIHTAIKAQAQGRNSPAIYKYGPPIVTRFPKRGYCDLPLDFFGGVDRRKRKRIPKMNMNEGNGELSAPAQTAATMTEWFKAVDRNPPVPGPWQCKLLGVLVDTEATHMRWFDGELWSWPMQPEHERADGFKKPDESHFMPVGLPTNIAWRGYTTDQEPL